MCQHVECHIFSFLFFFFFCHSLNVGACICQIVQEGRVGWTTPHHTIRISHFVSFHNVICYTNSIASRIHANTTKLHNITCTLVATGVILWRLGFSWLSVFPVPFIARNIYRGVLLLIYVLQYVPGQLLQIRRRSEG